MIKHYQTSSNIINIQGGGVHLGQGQRQAAGGGGTAGGASDPQTLF